MGRVAVAKRLPTLKQVEKALEWPAYDWAGKCFQVASGIVKHGLIPRARAVYGHFVGKVDPKSFFGDRAGMGFVQHGWIFLPDGQVYDPTRWTFENRKPYIYIGASDDYDEGGNRLRSMMVGGPPEFDPSEPRYEFTSRTLKAKPWQHVEALLDIQAEQEAGIISESQIRWLANASFNKLQPHAFDIYQAIATVGRIALIPFDNRRLAEHTAGKKIVSDD